MAFDSTTSALDGPLTAALRSSAPAPQPAAKPKADPTPPANDDNSGGLLGQKEAADYKENLADAMDKMHAADDRAAALKPPEMVQAPPRPVAQHTSPDQAWGSSAMTLATLGSLLTRRPITAALNAGAQVMQAYQKGDAVAAQQAMQIWKTETENATKLNKFQLDQYTAAIKAAGNDRNAARAQISALATAFKDEPLALAMQHGGLAEVRTLLHGRGRNADAMAAATGKLADINAANEYWDSQHPDANPQEKAMAHLAIRAGHDPDVIASKDFSPPQQIEVTGDDGKKQQILAQQDKKTGAWVTADEHRSPIGAEGGSMRILKGAEAGGPKPWASVTQEEKERIADNYNLTHQMPSLGYGREAGEMKLEILRLAADRAASKGQSPADVIGVAADLKANTEALKTNARTRINVAGFEGTATKEADLALSLASKGAGPSGSPIINRWIQAGRTSVSGDGDVSAFNAALTSFKNEYARIMSSPGGTGGTTSDSARNEASDLINKAQSPEMLRHVIATMKQGMQNRIKSIDEEHDLLMKKISQAGSGGGAPGAPTVGAIEGGHRFKGGDPANPASWEPVNG